MRESNVHLGQQTGGMSREGRNYGDGAGSKVGHKRLGQGRGSAGQPIYDSTCKRKKLKNLITVQTLFEEVFQSGRESFVDNYNSCIVLPS